MDKKILKDKMVSIDPTMSERIPKEDPFVLAKLEKAKVFIQKAGLPEECLEKQNKEQSK